VNPGFVRTSHQGGVGGAYRVFVTVLAKVMGTPPERAIKPLVALLDEPPVEPLSLCKVGKRFPVSVSDRDRADAERLHEVTERLLAG
jgi:hypothetical protein